MSDPHESSVATLRPDDRWLRELARQLVRDADTTDELVHEVQVALWRSPPRTGVDIRYWAKRVMQNLVASRVRSRANRKAYEGAVARLEFTVGRSDGDLERDDLRRVLISAVQELEEAQRVLVFARFYEGLTPLEIARREGLPVKTVYSRLALALDALRERLDRRHGGDRSVWVAAFAPFGAVDPRIGTGTAGVGRRTGAWFAAALVVLTIVAWGVLSIARAGRVGSPSVAEVQAARGAELASPGLVAGDAASARASVRAAAEDDSSGRTFVVEARDWVTLHPLADAEVRWWPLADADGAERVQQWFANSELERRIGDARRVGRTDTNGRTTLPATKWGCLVTASSGERWGMAVVPNDSERSVVIALRPDRDLLVRVKDPNGTPVAGRWIRAAEVMEGNSIRAETSPPDGIAVFKHGGYALPSSVNANGATWLMEFSISDSSLGSASPSVWIHRDAFDGPPVEFEVTPVGTCRVRVLDRSGAPIADERTVELHIRCEGGFSTSNAKTDSAGVAVFGSVATGQFVWVSLEGVDDDPAVEVRGPSEQGEVVEFTLVAEATSVSVLGSLVDEAGAPWSARNFSMRIAGRSDAKTLRFRDAGESRTDESGRFRFALRSGAFEGLEAPRVEVTVFDREGRREAVACLEPALRVGARSIELGLVVAHPIPALLAGRVVDASGAGVANARVAVLFSWPEPEDGSRPLVLDSNSLRTLEDLDTQANLELTARMPTGWSDGMVAGNEWHAITDGEGRFEFRGRRPNGTLWVRAEKAEFVSETISVAAEQRTVEVELVATGSLAGSVLLGPTVRLDEIGLRVQREDASDSVGHEVPIDAEGRFAATELVPGEYRLFFETGEVPCRILPGIAVGHITVRSGETTRDERLDPLDLRSELRRVTIHVLENGRPTKRELTFWRSSDFAVDGGDTFASYAPSSILWSREPLDLCVRCEGFASVGLRAVDADRTIELAHAAKLSVRVRNAPVLPPDISISVYVDSLKSSAESLMEDGLELAPGNELVATVRAGEPTEITSSARGDVRIRVALHRIVQGKSSVVWLPQPSDAIVPLRGDGEITLTLDPSAASAALDELLGRMSASGDSDD